MKTNKTIIILLALFAVLLSIPFLVPHAGIVALIAFVPLLCAQRLAQIKGIKRFFWANFAAFSAFSFITTWWVCKATVGGGILASVFNSFIMAGIFELFRKSQKHFKGVVPYVLLFSMWIAWERFNLTTAQLSWPWLVLGNAFGRTTTLVQWYEYTGTLGGSLWVWASNLFIYSLLVNLSNGKLFTWNKKAKSAYFVALISILVGPIICSKIIYHNYEERSDGGTMDVALAQSNFDPTEKLKSVPQWKQTRQVVNLFKAELSDREKLSAEECEDLLLLLPETFCSDIWIGLLSSSPTFNTFKSELVDVYPKTTLIFGASTFEAVNSKTKPHILAKNLFGDKERWYLSYNSAFAVSSTAEVQRIDKTKLVVGAEFTPYPKIFAPLDDAIGGLMGRCIPQGYAKCFNINGVKVGVPICYESIYPEFCTQYVKDGAELIAVITNDGWWGDTAGYRQHFSYSRLRAIELRRDIARCANTGISAFIDQKGDVLEQTKWWVPDLLHSKVNLSSELTFFAKNGDIVGRICTLMFILLLLNLIVKLITKK